MKILFLTIPYSVEDRYGKKMKKLIGPSLLPPLGLLYIAAVVEKDHEVKVIDSNIEQMNVQDIKSYLEKNAYDIICISLQTPMFGNFKKLISEIKPVVGKAKIVVGGPHPFTFPEDTIQRIPEVDVAVYGEGEAVFPDLLDAFNGKKKIADVKGIVYNENGEIVRNPPAEFVKDLDSIPFPARHLVPTEKYVPVPSTYRRLPMLHMIASRGCTFRCNYCASAEMLKRTIRYHSVKRVVDEMEHLIETYKVKEIQFLDDLFVQDRKWVMEFCDEVIKRGLNKKIEWSAHSRSGSVNEEMLAKMRKAGCWQLHFGAESGSQRLLNLVKKGITPQMSKDAIRMTRDAGIISRAYLMLGLPTETREESLETIKFAKELDPDYIKVSLFTPYPGTPAFNQVKELEGIGTTDWEYYKTMGGFGGTMRPYVPGGRSSEELNNLQKLAHKQFYFRPKIILRLLKNISTYEELKMYFKSALALLKA